MTRKKPKKLKGYMGHTFDTKVKIPATADTTTNANPATGTMSLAADATLLVVALIYGSAVAREGGAPLANGRTLTQADQARAAAAPEGWAELWYLLAPDTGDNVIVVPNTNVIPRTLDIFVSSYKAQPGYTTQFDVAAGTGTVMANPSVTLITTADGDAIIGVAGSGNNSWNPASQSGTALYNEDIGTWGGGAQYILQPTAGSVLCLWTESSEDQGIVAAAFKEVSAGTVKSLSDTGSGVDILSALSASLSRLDSGVGIDNPTLAALLGLSDVALGGDLLDLSADIDVNDVGGHLDQIANISANIPLPETGYGIDDIMQLLASISVNDFTSGQELITLSATLSISDTGFGTDELSILQSILKLISDIASGNDAINISATLSTTETASGQDALSLSVLFSLADTARGIDSPELSASLEITDGALGGDFLDLSAELSLLESGSGADTLSQLLANLSLLEIGTARDLLQLLASLSLSDTGSGTDNISISTFEQIIKSIADSGLGSDIVSISVSLSVQDIGTGTDALSISVSLTVLDTGTGLDEATVTKVEALLKSISDIASGSDSLSISATLNVGETVLGIDDPAILASLSLDDLAEGFESPSISAELSITDTAAATDLISILQAILKQIADIGTGTDAIGQISASIPVSEIGLGTDRIGQLLASLLVTDFGTGVDVIIKYDVTTQIIKISFIIKQNAITFELNTPHIGIELSDPTIDFDINPGG